VALPIQNIERVEPTKESKEQEVFRQLQESVAEHAEALQSLLLLVQDLQNSEVFDILHALFNSKEKISSIALEQILKPSVLNTIKNAMTAVGFVGKIPPDQFNTLIHALVSGLERGQEKVVSNQRIGAFTLVSALRDPDVNRAITWLVGFLKGMGEQL
jgi:uncharacterized protein YjgD (DUF1641 family)